MLYSQFVNRPSAEETPKKAIYQFFDMYGLASSHERLWQMLRRTVNGHIVCPYHGCHEVGKGLEKKIKKDAGIK